jgi:hypothetical protein
MARCLSVAAPGWRRLDREAHDEVATRRVGDADGRGCPVLLRKAQEILASGCTSAFARARQQYAMPVDATSDMLRPAQATAATSHTSQVLALGVA